MKLHFFLLGFNIYVVGFYSFCHMINEMWLSSFQMYLRFFQDDMDISGATMSPYHLFCFGVHMAFLFTFSFDCIVMKGLWRSLKAALLTLTWPEISYNEKCPLISMTLLHAV